MINNKQYRYKHKNHFLTKQQCDNVFLSANKCFNNGYPLNRYFTLLLENFGFDGDPIKLKNNLFKKTNAWLKYKNIPVAYIWVFEYGKVKGLHIHFIIHIPNGLQNEYKAYIKRYLNTQGIDTKEYRQAKALHCSSISYGIDNNEIQPLNAICCYITKGHNPQDTIVDLFGVVIDSTTYQGALPPIQRMGMSKLIYQCL